MSRRVCAFVAALAVVAGCGGGATEGGPTPSIVPQQTSVVQMDHDGDGELDLLTLDTSRTPYVIVEAIYGGVAGNDPVDVSGSLRGRELDVDLSSALVDYFAGSFNVGGRTELDVTDSAGHAVRVVVFE